MVEAMDDSLLIYSSLPLLLDISRSADRFQATYGWETEWGKSVFYAYNSHLYPATNPTSTISIPSVDYQNPSSPATFYHAVKVVTSHTVFLRVPINQPDVHFAHLNDLIEDFDFPVLHKRLPLTALRRIISQHLFSKIRPLLAFQPISRTLADRLDRSIASKVHKYLGFPFIFGSELLSLPISLRGFGFPCISTHNDALAVSGLHRDLNHHVDVFRLMANITLADWTCQYNLCASPLSSPGILRHPLRLERHIPHSWPTAQTVLRDLSLSLTPSDLSYITSGHVDIQHLYSLSRSLPSFNLPLDFIPSRTFANFSRYNMSLLFHFGTWVLDPDTEIPISFSPAPLPHTAPSTLRRDWPLLLSWFRILPNIVRDVSRTDQLLLLPRPTRQRLAENMIRTLHRHEPLPLAHASPDPHLLATDASLTIRPHTSSPLVTFAVVTDRTVFVSTLDNFRGSASIHRGEAYAIAAAHVLAQSSHHTLYTDHLNSVNLINSFPIDSYRLASNPARSIYRWVHNLSSRARNTPSTTLQVQHVRAHTSSPSIPAVLNRIADHVASTYHNFLPPPPPAPIPTFFMDDYMLHSPSDGWIETNMTDYIQTQLFRLRSQRLPFPSALTLNFYDHRPPPDYPYLHAPSSYSAVVQLYLRANQLDTAARLSSRMRSGEQPYCRFGCPTTEDARHIFVHCPRFAALRKDMDETTAQATSTLLDVFRIPSAGQARALERARTLSCDSESWPLGYTMYFYGVIPKLDDICPDVGGTSLTTLQVQRLRLRISATWHTACIRLAGRIWGIVKRSQRERVNPSPSPTRSHTVNLPSHLSQFISLSASNRFTIHFV